ncbi:MAG: tRNA pseudouridine(38-40) synthase TruA [Alphaproteobacteria bacterium]|nr:tRNA pseudouridine(38-40) synthase TruA [Alphaproteobacteria bacterium]
MPRYKITIEYDGTGFVGWQRQDNGLSIQHVIEEAVVSFSHEKVIAFASGRTDAGVHALGQVAHFDLSREYSEKTVRDAINAFMRGHNISVLSAERVDDKFHARFSSVKRSYLYRILNRRSPTALNKKRVWWVPVPLDVNVMHEAAQYLVGFHDFSSFRAVRCQAKSPEKTIDSICVSQVGKEIHINVMAQSFLHHQIRNIAGTLKLVGAGKWEAIDVKAALEARDRRQAGPTAPACGLYFVGVEY